jgi:hypothetical protein
MPNIDLNLPNEHRKGIVIVADGRCPENGCETSFLGGSFKLFLDGVNKPVTLDGRRANHAEFEHKDQPVHTSPVAECLTLIRVLDYVRDLEVANAGKALPLISILMDNRMVVGFANETMNAKEPHMQVLRARITTHPALQGVAVGWLPGKVVKRILGH